MSVSASLALIGLAFCGLLALGLATRSIKAPGLQVERDESPLMYWTTVGFHVFCIVLAFGAATVSCLQTTQSPRL